MREGDRRVVVRGAHDQYSGNLRNIRKWGKCNMSQRHFSLSFSLLLSFLLWHTHTHTQTQGYYFQFDCDEYVRFGYLCHSNNAMRWVEKVSSVFSRVCVCVVWECVFVFIWWSWWSTGAFCVRAVFTITVLKKFYAALIVGCAVHDSEWVCAHSQEYNSYSMETLIKNIKTIERSVWNAC